jgi:hypothetical protein
MRFTQKLATTTAAALLLVSGTVASAGTTTVNLTSEGGKSVRNQGHYIGTASYDDDAGKLMITLQNMSQRGFITGLAFDIAGADTAGYSPAELAAQSTTLNHNLFKDARGKNQDKAVKTKKFGDRETGTAINGKLRRRKGTKNGIAVGQSRTFEFDLAGTQALGLDAKSLFGDDSSLVVAFGGLKKKRRDIVTGKMALVHNVPDFQPIPDSTPTEEKQTVIDVPYTPTRPTPIDIDNGGETIPGGNNGGNNDGGAPHAVPLPPAAWAALATMGLIGLNGARRKLLVGR